MSRCLTPGDLLRLGEICGFRLHLTIPQLSLPANDRAAVSGVH